MTYIGNKNPYPQDYSYLTEFNLTDEKSVVVFGRRSDLIDGARYKILNARSIAFASGVARRVESPSVATATAPACG